MVDGVRNSLGLLMAPARLPSCFSFEDESSVPVRSTAQPSTTTRRLREIVDIWRRDIAARAATSRNSSAACW